jgi:hypothetical protein
VLPFVLGEAQIWRRDLPRPTYIQFGLSLKIFSNQLK